MKTKLLLLITLSVFINSYAQIGFEDHIVIDDTYSTFRPKVIAVDIDNDGDNDVVFASSYDNKIGWYENLDGQGSFGVQKIINDEIDENIFFGKNPIFVTDIDGDGDIDILFTSANNNKISWYENLDG